MFEASNCAAVIPCYNEAGSIAALVPAVRCHLPEVVVVDDGSIDGTGGRARAAGATVLRHRHNLGKGAALRTGLAWACSEGYAWAATIDGDGQHAPDDLPVLFQAAQEPDVALVIGNRMAEAQKMSWLRRQVNRWMSRQLSRRARQPLPDTQSGFRLVHLETWAAMALGTERFEVESEMLMAFLAAGRRVEFVPVRVIPGGRASRVQPVADTLRWLKWWRSGSRPGSANSGPAFPSRVRAAGSEEAAAAFQPVGRARLPDDSVER